MGDGAGQWAAPYYDVIVIGAGAGGICASVSAARFGGSVLLVEKSTRTGGDCTWHGCVPSKALLKCAKVPSPLAPTAAFALPAARSTWPCHPLARCPANPLRCEEESPLPEVFSHPTMAPTPLSTSCAGRGGSALRI